MNKPEIYSEYEKEQLRKKELGEQSFIEHFRKLANKRKASNHDNWISSLKHFEAFTDGELKFAELNEKLFEAVKDETVKQNIYFIIQRIEQAAFKVLGYTLNETEYYQGLFAKHFYNVLHSENHQTYIEDKIRDLHFYCKVLEQNLRTKQYEFLEDREQDNNQLTEAERYKVYLENLLIDLNAPAAQPINNETDTEKYTAKHYLLAYLFECNAKGESFPIGKKKELERIGNERMGAGKGNRFYKLFNEVINKDLNAEKNLFEIGGEYWRKAVIELSKTPELVEKYLQSKQL